MSVTSNHHTREWLHDQLAVPLFQAPMAGSQDSELAIAVSEAGGLGAIPCAMLSVDQVWAALTQVRKKTHRPINVNFFCHTSPVPDSKQEARWLETLRPYYIESDIDLESIPVGGGRQPFSADYLAAITPFKPDVVSFHFGLPDQALLSPIKAWGGLIAASATTLEEGLWLQAKGADLIIAQGLEAGGHRGHFLRTSGQDLTGQLPVRELLSELVSALECPVIAAGGVATPKDVAELMASGASGVQAGTAFLLTPEAKTSDLHRAALKRDTAGETQITNLFSGRPARGIVNRIMRELGPVSAQVPDFPLATSAIAPLRHAAEKCNSDDFSPLWAGTRAKHCREAPAADIIQWLTQDIP